MYKINVFQYFATIKGIQNYPYFFNAFLHKFKKKKKKTFKPTNKYRNNCLFIEDEVTCTLNYLYMITSIGNKL